MKKRYTRRELLKLASLIPFAYLARNQISRNTDSNVKNVLIIVFDAWSAHNISLLGYPRDTTPNLNRLAEHAIVYHNHYSTAPWTIPGTASLLTGVYPWTNRAFNSSGMIDEFKKNNLFNSFKNHGYNTLAYSHNPYVNILFDQLKKNIDLYLPQDKLLLNNTPFGTVFKNDDVSSALAEHQIYLDNDNVANSLLLSGILKNEVEKQEQKIIDTHIEDFPRVLTRLQNIVRFFILEEATDWVLNTLENLSHNFFGYFHFYPPHSPYHTRKEFINIFDDGWKPISKPEHIFGQNEPEWKMLKYRQHYDEFVAYIDSEFARLHEGLKQSNLLEDTWLILTTDHGERFERGSLLHSYYLLHNPVIQIPLVIFPPGQNERVDVYSRTSSIDLMPTLLHLTGQNIPRYVEGQLLPPFQSNMSRGERSVFSMKPKDGESRTSLNSGAFSIFQGDYKLIYYSGIDETKTYDSYFELYNIINDPEELNNLYSSHKSIADSLFSELTTNMREADAAFSNN
jgi:arylsulfatase A-like enzyme